MSFWRILIFVFLAGLFCAREVSSVKILKSELQAMETTGDYDTDSDPEKDGPADESDFFISSDLIHNIHVANFQSAAGFHYSEPSIAPPYSEIQLPPPEPIG